MSRTRFDSPLRKGLFVECSDGLVVKVLSDPSWDTMRSIYKLDVLIVRPKSPSPFGPGTLGTFVHTAPDRFGGSIFERISSRVEEYSLEEEYFSRPGRG